jgi:glutamine amidotransferase
MCRFVACLGAPTSLGTVLLDVPRSLLAQSMHPRHQIFGTGNPDGWGVAWSTPQGPRRHRSVTPMRDDPEAAGLATQVSAAFLAAVRLATPGMAIAEANTPPYVAGGWRFAHNGAVGGWTGAGRGMVEGLVSPQRLTATEGTTDSERLFAAILSSIDRGAAPADAAAHVVRAVDASCGGYLNVVLMDDERIIATAVGNSLFHRVTEDALVVASEPLDADDAWQRVPDRSLVVGSAIGVVVSALDDVSELVT